jgi:hypothetical protein
VVSVRVRWIGAMRVDYALVCESDMHAVQVQCRHRGPGRSRPHGSSACLWKRRRNATDRHSPSLSGLLRAGTGPENPARPSTATALALVKKPLLARLALLPQTPGWLLFLAARQGRERRGSALQISFHFWLHCSEIQSSSTSTSG